MSILDPNRPAVILAPMEGVTDAPMRALLSEQGGFTACVSEFLRISQTVPPAKVFVQHLPELGSELCTSSGVPVVLQLLGGDPGRMAAAAAVGVDLGAKAIDLNFGCPARTVNRHDGGAALLKSPERIRHIVAAVRAAVPKAVTVSVKLRLGWDDPAAVFDNAEAAVTGGADWLTVHGRTKVQGYKPWANWAPIAALKRQLPVPVVANGDIFTVADAARCFEITGCQHLMLGRGSVANPFLALGVARLLGLPASTAAAPLEALGPQAWPALVRRLMVLSSEANLSPRFLPGRIKQWGKMNYQYAGGTFYQSVKTLDCVEAIVQALDAWAASHNGAPLGAAQPARTG